MEELTDGLWRWTTRHPEFHPPGFGEVASFAARGDDGTLLLIDPLLPPEPADVLATLDAQAGDGVAILITIGYHVRSAAELAGRYDATVLGHARTVPHRLPDGVAFAEAAPGERLPGGATVHAIGRPVRAERPVHLAAHDALVFGDAVIETGGRLRVWSQEPLDADRRRFYRERFAPTLEPLVALAPRRVLVTHGAPVLEDGAAALTAAAAEEPWHPGS